MCEHLEFADIPSDQYYVFFDIWGLRTIAQHAASVRSEITSGTILPLTVHGEVVAVVATL